MFARWGVEKVFTVTLDNATTNDGVVTYVKRRVNMWKGLVLDGKFMHIRCGAHIVNLIINEGLKSMHDSIMTIHNCVRYIRSSPARLQNFKHVLRKNILILKDGWYWTCLPNGTQLT